jgi:hypothetical protein
VSAYSVCKTVAIIQDVVDRLIEIRRNFGVEKRVDRTKIRISGQPSPVQIMTDQKQPESVEHLNYLVSVITNEIKSGVVVAKAAFNKMEAVCTSR